MQISGVLPYIESLKKVYWCLTPSSLPFLVDVVEKLTGDSLFTQGNL